MSDNQENAAPMADLALLQQPEGETMERKVGYNAAAVGRVVCAFLNGRGGRVLMGVEDDGRLVGLPKAAETLRAVRKDIFTRVQPPASCVVSLLTAQQKELLLIEVAPGADGPYTYENTIFIRRGETTAKATNTDVVALVGQLDSTPRWEARPNLGCELGDLDEQELRQTANDANERRYANLPADPEHLLSSLYLLRNGLLTNAAIVLFARDAARYFPQTRVRAVHFADETRETILDNKIFSGHVFALLEQVTGFLQNNLAVQASLVDAASFQRAEWVSYPPAALREGLLNALVHRDYSRVDGGVILTLYPRQLEIWNAGGLPEGITLKSLREGGISRPGNPDLAHVLMLRGIIERVGIGGRRIVESCKAAGLPAPKWQERAGGMMLTFRLPAGNVIPNTSTIIRTTVSLNPRVLGFLNTLVPGQQFTAREYQRQAAADVSDRQARLDLGQLLKTRTVERRGSGQGTYYVRTEQPSE